MKNDPIEAYILKNARNVQIAAAVVDAYAEAREHIISGFLDRLETRLKSKLKEGWEYERWGGRFYEEAYPGYYFWKPSWDDQYWIVLQCGEHGKNVVFGVARDNGRLSKRSFCEHLLSVIVQHHPSAVRQKPWWEARVKMRSPATDWRNSEVLWRMHKDRKFLEEVAEQLLSVARVSEPIVDRLVKA